MTFSLIGLYCMPCLRLNGKNQKVCLPLSRVIRKKGTVPDFYEVQVQETGARVHCFVREEDLIAGQGQGLEIIKGGA